MQSATEVPPSPSEVGEDEQGDLPEDPGGDPAAALGRGAAAPALAGDHTQPQSA